MNLKALLRLTGRSVPLIATVVLVIVLGAGASVAVYGWSSRVGPIRENLRRAESQIRAREPFSNIWLVVPLVPTTMPTTVDASGPMKLEVMGGTFRGIFNGTYDTDTKTLTGHADMTGNLPGVTKADGSIRTWWGSIAIRKSVPGASASGAASFHFTLADSVGRLSEISSEATKP